MTGRRRGRRAVPDAPGAGNSAGVRLTQELSLFGSRCGQGCADVFYRSRTTSGPGSARSFE
ncbi:MAG: hypothetical protein M3137_01530, partial [Actinomycetota bacterium]|nr:hypothetical protein [Actinomycetota bacterium]